MSKVIVRNGNVDNALKTFKQRNVKDGLLTETWKTVAASYTDYLETQKKVLLKDL